MATQMHLEVILAGNRIATRVIACVAWRFCRAGRRSGVAAKFTREARENERRSREKNKNRLPGFVAFSTAAPFNSF